MAVTPTLCLIYASLNFSIVEAVISNDGIWPGAFLVLANCAWHKLAVVSSLQSNTVALTRWHVTGHMLI
jgi:hypothetical protein